MRDLRRIVFLTFVLLAVLFWLAPPSRAQDDTGETKGINSGNYNIQQTIEAGYRGNWVNGSVETYDTFVNLGQGFRLLDYTLDMRSLDHNGFLFDNLNFSNFGYGGDPNNVTRLRMQKNKWYDFRVLFRRDKNFWDWPLLANPLNPTNPVPPPAPPQAFVLPTPITSSPHSLDLVRRMQDYSLTIRPESKIRLRLGYSRNVDEGPALTTLDGGTEPILNQNYRVTTNSYHGGVDVKILPKTTISYDQFIKFYKMDTFTFDNVGAPAVFSPFFPSGFNSFQLADGSPVDLGSVWTATGAGGAPCASPITDSTTTPPTVKSTCNGFFNGPLTISGLPGLPAVTGTLPAYSNFQRPRNFMPTERLSFQSGYFKNLEMSGSFGYSTGDTNVSDFLEAIDGWTSRTVTRGSLTAGPAEAKRYSANADFAAVYSINDKLRLRDTFRFDNWRIPGAWTSFAANFVAGAVAPGGPTGMLAPISTFITDPLTFAANCTAAGNFNQLGCPQHNTGSLADISDQFWLRTLSENLKSNTLQVEYDFSRRLSARIGYQYTTRSIGDFNAQTDVLEFYFPGGAAGNAGNDFLAARADCALVAGVLPADCTLDPVTGIVTEIGPEADNDTSVNITTIHEHALLLGASARPIDKLRITADFAIGYNDNSFVRSDPRQLQTYKVHATYRPSPWASVDGTVEIHENRDNVFTVDNLEHDRNYGFSSTLMPNPRLAVDFGYTYWDFFVQTDICYASGVPNQPTTPCPIAGPADSPFGAQAKYSSTDHFVFADLMWKPLKRVTATLGYAGNFTRGDLVYFNQPQFVTAGTPPALAPVSLNANAPDGTLNFNYHKPYGSIAVNVYKGLTYKMAWYYYGFNEKGNSDPVTLAPIGSRDFNGSTAMFSLRYSF